MKIMGNRSPQRKPPPATGEVDKQQIIKVEYTHSNAVTECCPLEDMTSTTQTEDINEERNENVFYKFVILHAETDTLEATRVKDMLQDKFCIKPGLIFGEMPAGQPILKNLDNAVNGSAWTILLLTETFLRETWCEFQSHATLINSIHMDHKYNTVIPLRPKDNNLPREKTPLPLNLINALEEGKAEFTKQVEKTFQESLYQKQYAIWRAEKQDMEQ
ncbi:TIR domain-containing adapter molecule 2 [Pseudophryne corroboree]|uniref:TIR domain-containing adapter molecule 2 n=1 Tax=Pseudophryne corroboree TaxID=495146 RepID=UPI0030820B1F